MIELGGNITLKGFDELTPQSLIVVKKIVGNYVKKISTSKSEFEKLEVIHNTKENNIEIQVRVTIKDQITLSEAQDPNLFFALDKALSKLLKDVK